MERKKVFQRNIHELTDIFDFLKENAEKLSINQKALRDIELSVEEIFTNMVRHNSNSDQKIEISIENSGEQIRTCLTDHETDPFDITQTKEVDFGDYIREKRSGGLGIHLVKELMDDVKFEHLNGISKITIIKQI